MDVHVVKPGSDRNCTVLSKLGLYWDICVRSIIHKWACLSEPISTFGCPAGPMPSGSTVTPAEEISRSFVLHRPFWEGGIEVLDGHRRRVQFEKSLAEINAGDS